MVDFYNYNYCYLIIKTIRTYYNSFTNVVLPKMAFFKYSIKYKITYYYTKLLYSSCNIAALSLDGV